MRLVRPVVKTAAGVAGTVRDMGRMRQVAAVLGRYGFGALLARIDIPGLPKPRAEDLETTPEATAAMLQELGPTFIKLGQVLSTRPDILPPEYIEALQQLQDDVQPVPLIEVTDQLAAELGEDWRQQIASFDEAPLATASIAQVHRATLKDGAEVVLKIQRRGIARKIRSDLNILDFFAGQVEAEFPEAAGLDLRGVLREFDRSLRAELDFTTEARNTRRFKADFAEVDFVVIPELVAELSTERVLCMEFLDDLKIRQARDQGMDMARIGERYLHTAYTMLFENGFFHGDLHPGNVLVLPGERLGILDFGMVGRLTRDMKDALVSLLFALERGDHRTVARIFFDIAVKEQRVDYDAFEADVVTVVERNWTGTSVRDMQIGLFLMDVTQSAVKHRVRAPHTYTMFFKALLTTEGLAKALIPEVDPLAAARPFVQRMIGERWSQDRMKEEGFYNLVTFRTLSQRFPVTLSQLLDDVDKQRLKITVKEEADKDRLAAEDRRQNRLILAAFACTGALAGALTWDVRPVFDVPLASLVFWASAFPLFLLTLTMTLRNRG